MFINPGKPWENGFVELFIGKVMDELLNGEIFDKLIEVRAVIKSWRNTTSSGLIAHLEA